MLAKRVTRNNRHLAATNCYWANGKLKINCQHCTIENQLSTLRNNIETTLCMRVLLLPSLKLKWMDELPVARSCRFCVANAMHCGINRGQANQEIYEFSLFLLVYVNKSRKNCINFHFFVINGQWRSRRRDVTTTVQVAIKIENFALWWRA